MTRASQCEGAVPRREARPWGREGPEGLGVSGEPGGNRGGWREAHALVQSSGTRRRPLPHGQGGLSAPWGSLEGGVLGGRQGPPTVAPSRTSNTPLRPFPPTSR